MREGAERGTCPGGRASEAAECWNLKLLPCSASPPLRSIKIYSADPLNAVFHPSLLLSLGDLLAFTKALSPPPPLKLAAQQALPGGASRPISRIGSTSHMDAAKANYTSAPRGGSGERLPQQQQFPLPPLPRMLGVDPSSLNTRTVPPPLGEQMALSTPVTSRVPRRYIIHNLSGSTIYYSPADIEHAKTLFQKKHLFALPHGRSEKLKVDPSMRMCELQASDGTHIFTSYRTGVISIQFHGFWMPIPREWARVC